MVAMWRVLCRWRPWGCFMRQEAREIAQEGDVPTTQSRGDSTSVYHSLDISCPCRARVFKVWYPDRHCWKVEPSKCSPCHMGGGRPSQAREGPSTSSFALLPRHSVSDLLCCPHLLGSVASLHTRLKTMGDIDQGTGNSRAWAKASMLSF